LPFRKLRLRRVQGLKRRPGAQQVFIRKLIAKQFKNPRGRLGALAGFVMAHRSSNRQRNAWTVDLLDIAPDDRILEIGCGPGVAVAAMAARIETGHVVGVDHSSVMIGQAALRNQAAIRGGLVELRMCGMDDLPEVDGGFSKVLAVNVFQFLPDLDAACEDVARIMAPGGTLAVAYQPRLRKATHDDAAAFGDHLAVSFGHAGLVDIRMEELPLRPAPVVCVIGKKPKD
jgi:SAM-dependent methyltransferase